MATTDPEYGLFGNTALNDTSNILNVANPPPAPDYNIFGNTPLNDTRNIFNVSPPSTSSLTTESLAPIPSANFQSPNSVPVDMSHLLAAPTAPTPASTPTSGTTPPPAVDTSYTPAAGAAADPYALTAPEQNASDVIKRLQDLNTQYTGQSAFRTAQEEAAGIPALNTTESELTSRLEALKNEGLAIPMQLQQESIGRGITAGGLQPIQTAALRNNAIQSLLTQSQLASYQGKITLARAKVDAAVKQKFDPIKEQIDANTANLNLIINSPEYTNADKKRANDQLIDNKRKQQVLDFQKTNFETAQTMAAAAIKLNPNDQNALMAAQQAQKLDPADPQYLNKVFQLLGQFQSDPAAVQKDIDAHLQANANLLKTNADIEAIKADTTLTPLKKQKMIADINATNANAEQSRASAYKSLAEANAAGASTGEYVPGSNPTVDNWAKLIISGQASITQVPNPKGSTLRSQVVDAITNSGQLLLSDKDREKLSVLDSAFNVYDTIAGLSKNINTFGTGGRITGAVDRFVEGKLQTNVDIARYNAAREGFVSNIARTLGEKGALAEGDVRRAIANLPTINDTKAVAEGKLETLKTILEGAKTSIVQKSTSPLDQQTSGTLTVVMTGPEGTFNVPKDQVELFKQNGYK